MTSAMAWMTGQVTADPATWASLADSLKGGRVDEGPVRSQAAHGLHADTHPKPLSQLALGKGGYCPKRLDSLP